MGGDDKHSALLQGRYKMTVWDAHADTCAGCLDSPVNSVLHALDLLQLCLNVRLLRQALHPAGTPWESEVLIKY